ncbi:MAG: hypothetical protein A2Y17_03585 [Clostridiales bacterium GWF2_38_85]|nr:MAG: hypothetical protein A2Y17_03585 [Clostridiales bacterium GWF2_38_85]HBL85290.1 hypothetical protein [Clostridiales bacterium]
MKKAVVILMIISMLILNLAGCSIIQDTLSPNAERGTWNDNVYTNEFANLRFKNADNWLVMTDEEISKMMQLGIDYIDNDKYSKELLDLTTIYDMMVKNNSTN